MQIPDWIAEWLRDNETYFSRSGNRNRIGVTPLEVARNCFRKEPWYVEGSRTVVDVSRAERLLEGLRASGQVEVVRRESLPEVMRSRWRPVAYCLPGFCARMQAYFEERGVTARPTIVPNEGNCDPKAGL